jgi:hypothetical protein
MSTVNKSEHGNGIYIVSLKTYCSAWSWREPIKIMNAFTLSFDFNANNNTDVHEGAKFSVQLCANYATFCKKETSVLPFAMVPGEMLY